MTRRDAGLLAMTLGGLFFLYQGALFAYVLVTYQPSVMETADNKLTLGIITVAFICGGMAMIQNRRKYSTAIFGANPRQDTTAAPDAGDIRMLVVRILTLLLAANAAHAFLFPTTLFTRVLACSVLAFCAILPRTTVRLLFAAGPGDERSDRYRESLRVALAAIGAYYAVSFPPLNIPQAVIFVVGLALIAAARFDLVPRRG